MNSLPEPNGVFVIAEAGVNHNGSVVMAKQLVDAAQAAGADAVKFQSFNADLLATATAPKARYQAQAVGAEGSQREMLSAFELSPTQQREVFDHCRTKGMPFLSSPFDPASARFLIEDLRLTTIKVPSGELTNGPLLYMIGRAGVKIILSTGMADLDEIACALDVIAYGIQHGGPPAGQRDFRDARKSPAGRAALANHVVLLQCTTAYPAPAETINLRAMATLAAEFGLPVGLSDHSVGTAVPVAATALGAKVIEKHFTLDRNLPGPDHAASVEPEELTRMIADIRTVEKALGSGEKTPFPAEIENLPIARKSLVAAKEIAKGETFTPDNLASSRPGSGTSPMRFWDLIGTAATRRYDAGDPIEP